MQAMNEGDPNYGVPRIEGARCESIVEANLEMNKKTSNIFGAGGADNESARRTSTRSGVFGGAFGSFVSQSNASIAGD